MADKSLRYHVPYGLELRAGAAEATDETGVNRRAYFDRVPDDKMRQYLYSIVKELRAASGRPKALACLPDRRIADTKAKLTRFIIK
jgi:hypothetical protein